MTAHPTPQSPTPATGRPVPDERFNGWVLFDGECRFCVGMVDRFRKTLARHHFVALPLQTPWVRERLDLPAAELLSEMKLLAADGRMSSGADALLEIAKDFWWTWPIRQMSRLRSVKAMFRAGYRWMARNRNCASGICEVHKAQVLKHSSLVDYLPLIVLPLAALVGHAFVASWVFMWLMAFALFIGCKWLTWREAARSGAVPSRYRTLGYLLAWPGMDARAFLDVKNIPEIPRIFEWAFAAFKTLFGACLVWFATRRLLPADRQLAGWTGMIGMIFALHFGLFQLLSLAWRRAGVKATPVMQNPPRATSLSEFWSRRWNTAFNELAFRFTFRPIRRWTSPALAALLVFGLSGVIHELVISLPAGGGYGFPTLYFLGQGCGVIAERSKFGSRIGLGRGWRGRIFTLFVAAGPAFWLFHPPFVRNVILPMLSAIGAI